MAEVTDKPRQIPRQEIQNEIKKQGELVRNLKLQSQTDEIKQQVCK